MWIGLTSGVACSSSEKLERVSAEDAPAQAARVRCAAATDCDCGNSALSGDACEAEVQDDWRQVIDDAVAVGLTYDAECAGRVIDAIAERGCETPADQFGGIDVLVESDLCGECQLFHGDVAEGEPCGFVGDTLWTDCAVGLRCRRDVCVDPCATAALGEDCASSDCASGLRCASLDGGLSWQCVNVAAEGEPCDVDFCGEGLTCSLDNQTCVAAAAAGERCESNSCEVTAYCDRNAAGGATCVALKADGEPCDVGLECAVGWCDVGLCGPGTPLNCVEA